jgi:branched-chain amino acid transport system permease protein
MIGSSAILPARSIAKRIANWRNTALLWVLLAAFAVAPLLIPSPNTIRLLFITFLWVTTSIAWNLLGGFAGQVSFGFAVFYGVGAYTTALLMNAGLNPFIAFLASAFTAVLVSLFVGVPAFRLRGPYFAIATIGISEAVRVVMTNLTFTGGASGYRIVEHRPFSQREQYYTALVLASLGLVISLLIANAKFGMGLKAIRQDEDAAADLGVNPYTYKLAAHALAAALTGMAGGVFARYAAFIHPGGVFGFHTSVHILLMPVIGGIATVWGPVLGGFVFGIVEEEIVASFPEIHLLLYGILLIIIVLFEPGGILGGANKLLRRFRAKG